MPAIQSLTQVSLIAGYVRLLLLLRPGAADMCAARLYSNSAACVQLAQLDHFASLKVSPSVH